MHFSIYVGIALWTILHVKFVFIKYFLGRQTMSNCSNCISLLRHVLFLLQWAMTCLQLILFKVTLMSRILSFLFDKNQINQCSALCNQDPMLNFSSGKAVSQLQAAAACTRGKPSTERCNSRKNSRCKTFKIPALKTRATVTSTTPYSKFQKVPHFTFILVTLGKTRCLNTSSVVSSCNGNTLTNFNPSQSIWT